MQFRLLCNLTAFYEINVRFIIFFKLPVTFLIDKIECFKNEAMDVADFDPKISDLMHLLNKTIAIIHDARSIRFYVNIHSYHGS